MYVRHKQQKEKQRNKNLQSFVPVWQSAAVSSSLSDLSDCVDIVVYCGCGYTCSECSQGPILVQELILHFSTVASEKKKCFMSKGQNCCMILRCFLPLSFFFLRGLDLFLSNLTCCPAGKQWFGTWTTTLAGWPGSVNTYTMKPFERLEVLSHNCALIHVY